MSQQNLIQLAKQGNADAIAILMNRHLQPKGITAKAALKDECLQIMLEAAQVPNQQILVPFLQKGIASLGCEIIREIKVYGRQSGESFPDWHEELKLQTTTYSLPELAKQKDIKAITLLLNEWLKPHDINAKASLKGDCLQVMLEATNSPDRIVTSFIVEKLKGVGIEGLTTVKVYGKQSDEEFPDWTQEINLTIESSVSDTDTKHSSSEQESKPETNRRLDSLDSIELSNNLYDALQIAFSEALACRMEAEDDSRGVHEIVRDFSDGLEDDLTIVVEKIDKPLVDILSANYISELDTTRFRISIDNGFSSRLPSLRIAIRQLERVTQEVLSFDFPQETDAIKEFFRGAIGEFSANLVGGTTWSKEMIAGAAIGNLLVPGLGAAIGGAVGGWFSGNKKQKQIEEVLTKYQKARQGIFDEWELVLQNIYEQIRAFLSNSQAIELMPYASFKQAVTSYNQANAFFRDQELQKAIDAYDKALEKNPLFVMAWNNKGYALHNLDRYDDAIAAYDKAISIDANFAVPLFNKGLVLRTLERHDQALELFHKVVMLSPDDFEAWIYVCASLDDLERYDELLEACDKAITINPDHYLGWCGKASGFAKIGDFSQALDALEEAIAIDPESAQEFARTDEAFDAIRNSERFTQLMESAVGVDYRQLKKLLAEKNWKKADEETARVMRLVIKNLFDEDQAPSELDQDTIAIFPTSDLATIDRLWVENSEGKFGFSVQKKIYQRFGGTEKFNGSIRDKFGDYTGWRVKDSDGYSSWRSAGKFEYNFELAPKGHLPSSLWAGDGFFENSRDRLIALFSQLG